jgi:hypothetical protein
MRLTRQHLWTWLWSVLHLLSMVTALRALRHSMPADALYHGTCATYVLVLAALTARGVFTHHRGGWKTYLGLVLLFLGTASVAAEVGYYFWPVGPQLPFLYSSLLFLSLGALFLALGIRRHLTTFEPVTQSQS